MTVITAENLGKKYTIGHQRQSNYVALRDVIAHTARGFWQRLRHPLSPNQETTELEEIWALQDVSFEVRQGERIGIIGRNGAGKTTLLKVLSRITHPTTGRVHIKGRVASLLEVGTGFHPELTGRENVYLNGAILGMTHQEIKKKFDEIVAFAEVEKFLDTPVKRYSSGMYVRLAFAVAAHLEPEILLVDEVLAVGDVQFQRKCIGKMDEVAKEGRTVLFVSHNMKAVSRLCQTTLWVDAGVIINSGPTQDVIDAYLTEVKELQECQNAEFTYNDVPEKPAQIKRIRILDHSGMPSAVHDIISPIHIEVDFIVRRNFSNLFVSLNVKDSLGQFIYVSREIDWINYTTPGAYAVLPKESGYYKASIVLPAPLLNRGWYQLACVLAEPTSGRVDYRGGILIEVTDNKGSFVNYPIERQGWLAMPLQWQVKCLNE
jgi:lipopolysaccharide transport system ATP-binding protein